MRGDPSAAPAQLLAVGDADWHVAPIALGPGGGTPGPVKKVAKAIAARGLPTRGSSQFEGIATDGGGRVFVLQEGAARVLVLAADMKTLEHAIELHVPLDLPDLGRAWDDKPNARGEGLLLLGDGHILVAKQHTPVRLIEFGPAGDAPLGYAPGTALAPDEDFTVRGDHGSVLEVLTSWSLAPAANVKSVNDLAVDAAGRLHFVSSSSRCIGRLDADLIPGADEIATTVLPLPDALFTRKADNAEGLAFVDTLGWLVAFDLQRYDRNLHQVGR